MIPILFEDAHILVVIKPPQILSEATAQKNGLPDLLSSERNGCYIGVVHRLDRGVGGVMVYAKTPLAAGKLSQAVAEHRMQKQYLAIVHGQPSPSEATLTDLLFHDRMKNKTFVADRTRRGVKEARLDYRVLQTREDATLGTLSLLSVRLHTGRTHQIRVQFASRQHPLLGDRKYGAPSGVHEIGLFCESLSFPHPASGKPFFFSARPEGCFPSLFF